MTRYLNSNASTCKSKNIFIIAAENSAENFALPLIRKFRESGFVPFGIGGDRSEKEGLDTLIHNKHFSIVGIVEILSSLLKLKKYQNLMIKEIKKRKTCAAILVDYPDFNLRLAKKIHKLNIPVFYYVSPTVWAWRYSRINIIRKYITNIFLIYPFEKKIYEKENIPHTYTGNQLAMNVRAEMSRSEFRKLNNIKESDYLITLMPGSRNSEISFLLPEMLNAVKKLRKNLSFSTTLIKAENIDRKIITDLTDSSETDIRIFDQEQGYNLINASDFIISACGTANLEIALLEKPFISIYKVNKLSYLLGKNFLKINLYSIINIIAGYELIPELIQSECNGEKIAEKSFAIIKSEKKYSEIRSNLHKYAKLLIPEEKPSEVIFRNIRDYLKNKR